MSRKIQSPYKGGIMEFKLGDVPESRKWDRKHPILKVPGTGLARWDKYIGRWVVGRLSYEPYNELDKESSHL